MKSAIEGQLIGMTFLSAKKGIPFKTTAILQLNKSWSKARRRQAEAGEEAETKSFIRLVFIFNT